MSTQPPTSITLKFRRPGGIVLELTHQCDRFWLDMYRTTKRNVEQLASINCVRPENAELHLSERWWTLVLEHARFHVSPSEAQAMQERFGIPVHDLREQQAPAASASLAGL
jgi:hypothetical protein